MSQHLGSLPPPCRKMSICRPPPPPLTCDVIYGCPLTFMVIPRGLFQINVQLLPRRALVFINKSATIYLVIF